jgi:hypothetical protein
MEISGVRLPESSIGGDFCGIMNNLLMLAEETIVMWAKDNLHFTGLTEIVLIPEEKRNAENPQIYMVAPSAALMQKLDGTTAHEAPPAAR